MRPLILQPAPLTFLRAYAGISTVFLLPAVLLAGVMSVRGGLSHGGMLKFNLGFLGLFLFSIPIAWFDVRRRAQDRQNAWEASPDHLSILRAGKVVISFPWSRISAIRLKHRTLHLHLHGQWLAVARLPGMTATDYRNLLPFFKPHAGD